MCYAYYFIMCKKRPLYMILPHISQKYLLHFWNRTFTYIKPNIKGSVSLIVYGIYGQTLENYVVFVFQIVENHDLFKWRYLFFPEHDKMSCCGIVIYTYQSNRKCNKTLYGISNNVGIKILILPLDYSNKITQWLLTIRYIVLEIK